MAVAGGGFEQCYNAQAAVAADSLLVVAADVVQAPNDKQQLEPMLGKLAALPGELGNADALLADNGYFSESNVNACAVAGIAVAVIAMGREAHHPTLDERFAGPLSPPASKDPTPLEAMDHRLQTPGKARNSTKALRKTDPQRAGSLASSTGARVPPVPAAWPRQCARRVEPRDHGVEHQADVRPGRRKPRRNSQPFDRQLPPLAQVRGAKAGSITYYPAQPLLSVRKPANAPDARCCHEDDRQSLASSSLRQQMGWTAPTASMRCQSAGCQEPATKGSRPP